MNMPIPTIDPSYRRICVLSSSFSGSTILSIMLCQDEKYIGFGDTYIIRNVSDENDLCNCKETIVNCPYRVAVAKSLSQYGIPKEFIYKSEYAIPFKSIAKRFGGTRIVKLYNFLGAVLGHERIFGSFLKRERIYLNALL